MYNFWIYTRAYSSNEEPRGCLTVCLGWAFPFLLHGALSLWFFASTEPHVNVIPFCASFCLIWSSSLSATTSFWFSPKPCELRAVGMHMHTCFFRSWSTSISRKSWAHATSVWDLIVVSLTCLIRNSRLSLTRPEICMADARGYYFILVHFWAVA